MSLSTYQTRRKTEGAGPAKAPKESQGPSLSQLQGGAMPTAEQLGHKVDLPGAIRSKMEASFGADLSGVELYESQTVADAGAQAMTMGNRIGFAPGALDFSSSAGQALLGHELSHVVSQARGEVGGRGFLQDRMLEARADREGALAAAGESVYTGPVTPISVGSSAMAAAGPVQARKAKSKSEMLRDDFDTLGTASANAPGGSGNILYNSIFSEESDRRQRDAIPASFINATAGERRQAGRIGTAEEGLLLGNVYRPAAERGNGKHVILYSGSGGSNQDQMGEQVKKYLQEGYTVHAYDYGGYGGSSTPDNKVSERSMQRDAQRIFDHVLQHGGADDTAIKAKDVLLHGFSMGGAMASHVARNQAIRAAKAAERARRQDSPEVLAAARDQALGGLVLESSMRTTKNAAKALIPVVGGMAGGIGGRMYGEFDTMANLEEISKLDQDMPVTVLTGQADRDDHLAESNTHLYRDNKNRFKHIQLAQTQKGHMDQGKLSDSWDGIKDGLMRWQKYSVLDPAKAGKENQDRQVGKYWQANNRWNNTSTRAAAMGAELTAKYAGPGYVPNMFTSSLESVDGSRKAPGLNPARLTNIVLGATGEGLGNEDIRTLYDRLMSGHRTDLDRSDPNAVADANGQFDQGARQLKQIYYNQLKRLRDNYGTMLTQMHPEDVLRQVDPNFQEQFALLQDTEQMLVHMPQYFDFENSEEDREFKQLNNYYNNAYGVLNQYANTKLTSELGSGRGMQDPNELETFINLNVGNSREYQQIREEGQEDWINGPKMDAKQEQAYLKALRKRAKGRSWSGALFGHFSG